LTRAKNVSEDWYVLSALSLNEKLRRPNLKSQFSNSYRFRNYSVNADRRYINKYTYLRRKNAAAYILI